MEKCNRTYNQHKNHGNTESGTCVLHDFIVTHIEAHIFHEHKFRSM